MEGRRHPTFKLQPLQRFFNGIKPTFSTIPTSFSAPFQCPSLQFFLMPSPKLNTYLKINLNTSKVSRANWLHSPANEAYKRHRVMKCLLLTHFPHPIQLIFGRLSYTWTVCLYRCGLAILPLRGSSKTVVGLFVTGEIIHHRLSEKGKTV